MPKKFLSKEEGLELFCKTFTPAEMDEHPNRAKRVSILMRFILAIDAAATHTPNLQGITFNGERPNDYDALGHYIINGGRIFFDLSKLKEEEQKWFAEFIMPKEIVASNIIFSRLAATHQIDKKAIYSNGNVETFFHEKKVSPLKSLINFFKTCLNLIKPQHFAMHIGIGGAGNMTTDEKNENITIRNNGQFGHLYFNTRQEAIQMGLEEAGPGMAFKPAGGWHGADGKGIPYSACMTKRLAEQTFGPNGEDIICSPDDKNNVYAWNRVLITLEVITALKNKNANELDGRNENAVNQVINILNRPPKNYEVVKDYEQRSERMRHYRTKNGLVGDSMQDNAKLAAELEHLPATQFYNKVLNGSTNTFLYNITLLALLKNEDKHVQKLQDYICHKFGNKSIKDLRNELSNAIKANIKYHYHTSREQAVAMTKVHDTIATINKTVVKFHRGEITLDQATEAALNHLNEQHTAHQSQSMRSHNKFYM